MKSNDGDSVREKVRILTLLLIALGTIPLIGCASERSGTEERYEADRGGKVTNEAATPDRLDQGLSVDSVDEPVIDGGGVIRLSTHEFIVEPDAESAAFRLYVINETATTSTIDNVDPSCGCILTTVQRRRARPGDSAEIYVALLTEQMSRTQPYTVDVTMTTDPKVPLRMKIWHREAYDLAFPQEKN